MIKVYYCTPENPEKFYRNITNRPREYADRIVYLNSGVRNATSEEERRQFMHVINATVLIKKHGQRNMVKIIAEEKEIKPAKSLLELVGQDKLGGLI